MLKAITLTEPWALLNILDEKRYETRSWSTSFRGEIAVHAAVGWSKEDQYLCGTPPFSIVLRQHGFTTLDQIPRGVILGLVNLANCHVITPRWLNEVMALLGDKWLQERAFGNYTHGRYAYRMGTPFRLKTPVPCRGAQKIWTVPPDIEAKVRRQIGNGG